MREIVPGLVHLDFRVTSAYLIVDSELTLIDAGMRRGAERILRTIRELSRAPTDLTTIVATHHHVDHVGGLARVAALSGGTTAVHRADAAVVTAGDGRRIGRSPGPFAPLVSVLSHLIPSKTDPARVDRELEDGDVVAGLRVVHTPGHTAGHVSLLWEPRRVLFVGDAFANMLNRARYGSVYEDLDAGKRSIAKIAELDFDVAVFGHGTPVVGDAAQRLHDRLTRLAG